MRAQKWRTWQALTRAADMPRDKAGTEDASVDPYEKGKMSKVDELGFREPIVSEVVHS